MKRIINRRSRCMYFCAQIITLSLIFIGLSPLHSATGAIGSGSCAVTVGNETGTYSSQSGQYCYITFTTEGSNSFTAPTGITSVDLMLIGGGGAGGSSAWAGGGGAGEVVSYTNYSVTPGSAKNLFVGSGGTSGPKSLEDFAGNRSIPGTDSWIGSSSEVIAAGGGAGASFAYYSSNAADSVGGNGGSGGGGTETSIVPGASGGLKTASSSGTKTGYGNNGGRGGQGAGTVSGGGGGGAGAAGSDASTRVGGAGGAGTNAFSSWISAISSVMPASWQSATSGGYIGGGGGGGASNTTRAAGGSGGGGNGGSTSSSSTIHGLAGVANTGSGGGGATYNGSLGDGGSGGSGLVVIRFSWASISSISPNYSSTAGGKIITILGSNFTGATGVSFGGSAGTSLTVNSDSSITVTAPANSLGAVDVTITLPGGSITSVGGFTYVSSATATLNDCEAAINDPLYTKSEMARIMGYANVAALESDITSGARTVWIASGAGTFGASASGTAPDLFCGDSNNNTVSVLDSTATTSDYFFGGAGNDTVTNSWFSFFYGGTGNDSAGTIAENSKFYGGPGTDSVTSVTTGAVFYQEESPLFSSSTPTFPDTVIGNTSAAQTVTVTNSGDAALVFGAGAVTKSGSNSSDFTVVTDNCSSTTVAVSGTCTVTVTFSPSAIGTRSASLSFASNTTDTPNTVALSAVALGSPDATLSSLTISGVTLSPSFNAATNNYTSTVPNSTSSINITPTRNNANATIQARVGSNPYVSVSSGTASGTFAIAVGSNTLNVKVTAQDGTVNTYVITISRTGTGSNDATLSALVVTTATLSPSFDSATTSYTASVANGVSSVTVTPTRNQANASITVNGSAATSGSATSPISLSVGSNTITVVVTAQDAVTTKTYTVTITRAAAASTDATLSALVVTTATLSPSFDSATTSYTASVANGVSSVTVTPTRNQANASITVNGSAATSGSATSPISLSVGSNTITVVVTAQDAATTSTYLIVITRESASSGPGRVFEIPSNIPNNNTSTDIGNEQKSSPVDLGKNPDANKLTWNSSAPVKIVITDSFGKSTEQILTGNSFDAPKPQPGESIKVTVSETTNGSNVLKTVELATPPYPVASLRITSNANRNLVASWTPKSSVKKYLITITPKVGAPITIESKDSTIAVQTLPGQNYRFEVVAVGEGDLKAEPVFATQVAGRGAPISPLLTISQNSKSTKIKSSLVTRIEDITNQIDSGSSVLITATVKTRAERQNALKAAINAASQLQKAKSELWVKSVVTVDPKIKKKSNKVTISFSVVIRPIDN